jgi:hypothetical protein
VIADCHVACCRASGVGLADAATANRLLSAIEFRWSSAPLTTLLSLCSSNARQALDASEATTSAFAGVREAGSAPRLWLQSGVLGGGDAVAERAFLKVLGTGVLPSLLRAGGVAIAEDKSLYADLLECWKDGPSRLREVCAQRDVVMEKRRSPAALWTPGSCVPLKFLKYVQQDSNCIFLEGGVVAIRDDDDDDGDGDGDGNDDGDAGAAGTRYRIAKVLPLGDQESSETGLFRMYCIDVGSAQERR